MGFFTGLYIDYQIIALSNNFPQQINNNRYSPSFSIGAL